MYRKVLLSTTYYYYKSFVVMMIVSSIAMTGVINLSLRKTTLLDWDGLPVCSLCGYHICIPTKQAAKHTEKVEIHRREDWLRAGGAFVLCLLVLVLLYSCLRLSRGCPINSGGMGEMRLTEFPPGWLSRYLRQRLSLSEYYEHRDHSYLHLRRCFLFFL